MSEEKKGWYVLRAISGKESKVKEVLDAEIKNTDLGNYVFQVLIPTEKVYTVRNGKKVVKEKNLYSGYVFVEAILVGEVIHHLRRRHGRVRNRFGGCVDRILCNCVGRAEQRGRNNADEGQNDNRFCQFHIHAPPYCFCSKTAPNGLVIVRLSMCGVRIFIRRIAKDMPSG